MLDSDWGEVQPNAEAQNAYLERHSWDDYAAWHLGLTEGANDETKARYAFVYGDLRRVHRSGLIACVYRASEWRHKEVELAAHELLQHLDRVAGHRVNPGVLAQPLVEVDDDRSPSSLPMVLRTAALTGSLWVPSPSAMNELSKGSPSTVPRTLTSPLVSK